MQPPPPLQTGDPSAADPARLRLSRKRSLFKIPSVSTLLRSRSSKDGDRNGKAQDRSGAGSMDSLVETEYPTAESLAIDLEDSSLVESNLGEDRDVYRWAVIYENQRGLTLFSTAYYSPLSLLPRDPPPFTVPEADGRKNKQPQVSLSEYPLPDGTWRWVSKSWMIDMRDDGDVQYDGFEYNWFFRRHKWRAQVGNVSAGGWVRRRRWIRLMMRPGRTTSDPNRLTNGVTPAPSSQTSSYQSPELDVDEKDVWKGDSGDWRRCHLLMRQLGRDGKKLEVWRDWLGLAYARDPTGKRKQWTEDEYPLPSEVARDQISANWRPIHEKPPVEYIHRVLHDRVEDLLQLFVYPASRAQFLGLLGEAGIAPDRNSGALGRTKSVDFWSYSQNLSEVVDGVREDDEG